MKDATFIGLVGLVDPPVPGVRATLNKMEEAGINTLFVTGEDIETTKHRMSRLGYQLHTTIPESDFDGLILEADHFRKLVNGTHELFENNQRLLLPNDQEAFASWVHQLKVLCNATPDDKLLLSCGFRAEGK